ncbi:centromere-associated protein E isoform X3 [Echeneis naucrates]|uniref:centromere-associated protein E isoform X3 n=1 Tax=Echeneis naucrates TaxID=173247 RepID=UPI0011135075|nr:centromere-associated protein E isoform X3 [Echeneis naucrates]
MTEESAVSVCIRVRPLIAREESATSENAEPHQHFWKADKKSVYQLEDGNSTKSFSFDRVFTAEETTNQLYQDIAKPLVVSSVEGYNGTIFAYGQTSSGKTFTMMGGDHVPGVMPLAVEDVFQTIKNCPKKEFLLRVSYMEIYNETVSDLLVDSWKRRPLEVRETINKSVYVADLTEELVTSSAQALVWIRKGEKNRHYGKTKMNQRSSRSHTIFRMILESRERSDPASGENADGAIIVSHLNLVDLAGSERASQTGTEGARFKEGCNINRSLFTLGQVIKKLTDEGQKGFVNYRDSKLTRILQNSLGGNAKTLIICTITPNALDETLSTLQFASTAKKMKNDPHVTEVSDDGALLKRYRNEIVDLKRRLYEVSSITQTTATEKEVLSQLLQEKDQLQREQEDRIKNLTKLLVTSSNLVPLKKMPKRRMTWGGKLLRLAHPSNCESEPSDSFAESFTRKRKADPSCLMEMTEVEDEDFDSHWEIPEELMDDLEMSHSSVTVRNFRESPKDTASPDQMHVLTGKVSELELKLEMESQQKEEAMTKVQALDCRVAELQLQLQTATQQKREALEKMETTETRVAELELQKQTAAQQKIGTIKEVEMLQLRVTDLERQLEDQRHARTEAEQMSREFAETIHLCETLASEKMVAAERDYLKQELGIFIEQTEILEKEKSYLQKELEENRALDEFRSLEEECRMEQENQLKNEILSLKMIKDASELRCQELQNMIESMSDDLKRKTEFAEELQSVSGKDLVQEVAKLRRSLDDAEGITRDTKKEWAVLRSQNMALDEMNVTLTANRDKIEAELNSLHCQLETEKTRNRKMQSDLQKELNSMLEENTKLTALLDGKVPKNLINSVELDRTVSCLKKQLTASREAEGALRAQLEELTSLPNKVDNLMKQTQRDSQLLPHTRCQEEAQQLSQDEILKIQTNLGAAAQREKELSHQCADVTQQLEPLQSDLECSDSERRQLIASVGERDLKRQNLLQELECVRGEKDTLLNARAEGCAEEVEKLLSALASLTAERDQLKLDLQENVEMMIENQEALRTALEKNQKQKAQIRQLVTAQSTNQDGTLNEMRAQLEEKQTRIQQLERHPETTKEEVSQLKSALQENEELMRILTDKLEYTEAERDSLRAEKEDSTHSSIDELEKLLCRVTSLTQERDQLQETLEGLRQEKVQLRVEQDDKMEILHTEMRILTDKLEYTEAERDSLRAEKEDSTHSSTDELEKLLCRVTSLTQERDQLQETLEGLRHEKEQLRVEQDDKMEILHTEMRILTDKLEYTEAERDSLRAEKEDSTHSSTDELEKLLCRVTSLTQERDQLQETLEGLRQEKVQLRVEQDDKMEILHTEMRILTDKLEYTEAERDSLRAEKEDSTHSSTDELEKLLCRVTSLTQERDQLQETLEGLRQEKVQLRVEQDDKMEILHTEMRILTDKLEYTEAERDSLRAEKEDSTHSSTDELEKLLCRVTSLTQERDQLQETLEGLRQEKVQLRVEQDDKMEILHTEMRILTDKLEYTEAERDSLRAEKEDSTHSSTDELEKLLCRVTSLTQERDQLQETLEGLRQEKVQLRVEQDDKMEILHTEMRILTDKLEYTEAERDSLRAEKEDSTHSSTDELEKLLCRVTSLTQERDQLQETLEGLRQEKVQLRVEQDDKMEILHTEMRILTDKLEYTEAERDSLRAEKEDSTHSSTDELEKLLCRVTSLTQERDQLQETLEGLRQEKVQLRVEQDDKMEILHTEMRILTDKLEYTEAERDSLRAEKEDSTHSSTDELEKLLCRVTSLTQERDQLQETLEGLRQEKVQLRVEQDDKMEILHTEMRILTDKLEYTEAERDSLRAEKEDSTHSSTDELEKLLCRVTSLTQERDQLQETLEGLRQEKVQLRVEQDDKMEILHTEMRILTDKLEYTEAERDSLRAEKEDSTHSSTDELEKLLCRVTSLTQERDQLQETLEGLRQEKVQLRVEQDDKMEILHTEMRILTDKLEYTEAERDSLRAEKEDSTHSSTDELEKLLCRVTSLTQERDQLQETLEGLRQEKVQLRVEQDDKMEILHTEMRILTDKLEYTEAERDSLRAEKEDSAHSSTDELEKLLCRVTSLTQERDQLKETLEGLGQEKLQLSAELDVKMEMISAIQQKQLNLLQQSKSGEQDARLQQEEFFSGFKHFIDTCSKYTATPLDKALRVQCYLKPHHLTSLPKPTMISYSTVCQLGLESIQSLGNITVHLQCKARGYRNLFEELVKKDLAVFEERRLQDLLLCRAQTPSFSVRTEDFSTLWEHRLTELLDKRQLYQQKMAGILEKLWANIRSYPSELAAEIRDRERFKEQIQVVFTTQPISFNRLDTILSQELERRSAVVDSKKTTLQAIIGEHSGVFEELKQLEVEAYSQLTEEKRKSHSLLQALEGAFLNTEDSLLKDNQQLVLQLQQTQEKVIALCFQNEQLEEAQINANHRLSNHKQATQLLQTELQDSRTHLEEKENIIQTLKSKLQESEKNAAELEKLQNKQFKKEVELNSAFDKHQQEIQRMTTVLQEKDDSLRRMKETLRRTQQQEESFLQGEDLHAKLTNPRGLLIKSSILLEKNKMVEEVKQLQGKISELENLVSSQQADLNKWKNRAIKLKDKSKPEAGGPSSPCTPRKQGLPLTSDSIIISSPKKFLVTPKKILDSPRNLDSPKSIFFDLGGSSEFLSRTCPKQFFDNSSLGTIPEVSHVPDAPAADNDGALGAAKQEEWWPQSPKQEDMCKTQ